MYPLSIRLLHHSELDPLAQFMNRLLMEQHIAYNAKREGIAKKRFLQLDTYSIILFILYVYNSHQSKGSIASDSSTADVATDGKRRRLCRSYLLLPSFQAMYSICR